ncbi:hypothetical protein J6590_054444 [Homalodisca vitripennis]|nr:hypothetical protein J6590_054444 [Homalodisca vitripennis]
MHTTRITGSVEEDQLSSRQEVERNAGIGQDVGDESRETYGLLAGCQDCRRGSLIATTSIPNVGIQDHFYYENERSMSHRH